MERYTYEIRPNKPFNFMDKTIKSNCSLQLSISEALTIVESNKARVYRIFPDINNSVKVDKSNINELHRKYFNSKPIINRANSITEKALDKSEDKVISSNDAFVEVRENEKKEIVKAEPVIKEVVKQEEKDEVVESKVEEIIEEETENTTEEVEELKNDSAVYNFDTKEVVEQEEEDKVIESEVVSDEVESPIVEEDKEEVIETEETTETVVEEEKKENKNRFYNTQIMTGGKKKHKK